MNKQTKLVVCIHTAHLTTGYRNKVLKYKTYTGRMRSGKDDHKILLPICCILNIPYYYDNSIITICLMHNICNLVIHDRYHVNNVTINRYRTM